MSMVDYLVESLAVPWAGWMAARKAATRVVSRAAQMVARRVANLAVLTVERRAAVTAAWTVALKAGKWVAC